MFNKLNNLEQIEKFLEKHNKTRLTYEEIEYLNRPIMSKEIKIVNKNQPTKRAQKWMAHW